MQERSFSGYGATIRKYRTAAGFSQAGLAAALAVTRGTIVNWELERSQPDMYYLRRLCRELGIPPAELLQTGSVSPSRTITGEEREFLTLFRELDDDEKLLAGRQLLAIRDVGQEARRRKKKALYFMAERQYTRPAAGSGNLFADLPPTLQFIRHTPANDGADAVIAIDGRSMEPVYHSGDLIYVRYTDSAEPGDIVVCTTADGAVIKCVDNQRRLYSLNEDFPYGPKSEDDHVRILGKVLGTVQPGDLPDQAEAALLEELFGPEAAEFKKKHGIADA